MFTGHLGLFKFKIDFRSRYPILEFSGYHCIVHIFYPGKFQKPYKKNLNEINNIHSFQ